MAKFANQRRNPVLLLAILLALPAAASAQTFYFNGYGGFSDPSEIIPTTPADGADSNSTVDFLPLYVFDEQSTADTDRTAWQSFGWDTGGAADHSHLSINELTPDLPPASSTFADPVQDTIVPDDGMGEVAGWLIHHNEIAGGFFGPDNIAVHYHLDIYADSGRTVLLWSSGPMDFTLDMMETFNPGVNGVCLDNDGGRAGAPTGYSPLCPDRFRVARGWPVNPPGGGETFDQVIGTFRYQDKQYAVTLSGFWDNDILVGEAWSAEGSHNQFDIRARVDSVPSADIPAAPPLGLLLLALVTGAAGLGALRRRGAAS